MKIDISYKTHTGNKRTENQDNMAYLDSHDRKLFIVADGMGGYAGGKLASTMTVSIIQDIFNNEKGKIPQIFQHAISQANREIFIKAKDSEFKQMGSTVAALAIKENHAYIAHVGDSRIYLFRNGSIKRLTKDHSKLQRMIDKGEISSEEAFFHPESNVITRCLGAKPIVEVDAPELPLKIQSGDIFLICSDGLCGQICDDKIENLIKEGGKADDICEKLIDEALNAGGDDNITVQVIMVKDLDEVRKDPLNKKIAQKSFFNIKTIIIVIVGCFLWMYCSDLFNRFNILNYLKSKISTKAPADISDVQKQTKQIADKLFGSGKQVGNLTQKSKLNSQIKEIECNTDYQYKHQDCDVFFTDIAQQVGYRLQNEVLKISNLSVNKENQLGKQFEKQIAKMYDGKLDIDQQWLAYIRKVGNHLTQHVNRKGIRYHFHVINDSTVNAFAIPGGGVYIFKGILNKIRNEAQLVSIIAHEIKHIDLKHCISIYEMIMSMPDSMQNSISLITTNIIKHLYNARQEADADRRGIEMVYACGYSPYQYVLFWESMKGKVTYDKIDVKNTGSFQRLLLEVQNVLLTHPKFPKRICFIKNHIIKLQKKYHKNSFYVGKWNYLNRTPMFEKQI
ncbi:Protein serine/threonine phosphatase-containing protein [Candidatus Magnetomorum sp. HK-1]|nr:Protein serine/threonine phosphatase-containing protein [Candidatus Magnetomorum sp. HK-1]